MTRKQLPIPKPGAVSTAVRRDIENRPAPPPFITVGVNSKTGAFVAGYGLEAEGETPDAAIENLLAFLDAHGVERPEDYGVLNLYHKNKMLSTEELSK